jgi:signal transduction histidine kinase
MTDKQPLVLVVDDHYPAAEMVSRLFSSNEYRVLCAYNGEDALVQAEEHLPDLILLDVMMPGINGFEVLKILRQRDKTAEIPAIMVTARDAPTDIEYGLNLGADDYIPKPVEPRELLARAKSKIEAHRLRNALQQRTRDLEALLLVGEALNGRHKIDELENLMLQLLLELLPGDAAFIAAVDENGNQRDTVLRRRGGKSSNAKVNLDGIHARFQDVSSVLWTNEEAPDIAPFAAGMAVRLEYDNRFSGVLAVFSGTAYDDHHLRLFQGIGRQAALAMRNAELYEMQIQYAENLEDMVEERTRELRSAQQLLVLSEKLASVGRLAAGIAHEINNPLQPILINMELMVEDIQADNPVSLNDVQETLNSARRIKRTVERLLQFTRKRETGSPDMELLHLATVLENVVALSQKFFQQEGITIHTTLDMEAQIHGNRDQLEQVFLNLMLNARAAMQRGGVLTMRSWLEQNRVVIQVSDTGAGISPENLSRIFEPFFTTREDGNGLGLFISHEIIQNHNGSIDVSSQPGEGTTFIIQLPAAEITIDTEAG